MKANDITIHVVGMLVVGDTNTINILGQFVTRRNVAFHGDASKRRSRINREDTVLVIDSLESL